MVALAGCYSNNCPVENLVTCNYFFYDTDGKHIKYGDYVTVSAILPGGKNVYTYRRLGNPTITSDVRRPDLIAANYVEREEYHRRDTVLVNQAKDKEFIQVEMSYFNPVDTLLFKYGSISTFDTVYVEHESFPHVDLPECGSFRYHRLKSVRATDAAIDHIEISNTTVNYDGAENIKIFFNGLDKGN